MGLSGDRRSSAKLIKLDICFAELRRPECNSAIDNTLLSSPPSLPSWRARDDIRDPFIRLESSLAFLARHRSLAASSHRHLVSRSGKQNLRMFQTRFSIRWLNALRDNERGHPRGYRLRSLPPPLMFSRSQQEIFRQNSRRSRSPARRGRFRGPLDYSRIIDAAAITNSIPRRNFSVASRSRCRNECNFQVHGKSATRHGLRIIQSGYPLKTLHAFVLRD